MTEFVNNYKREPDDADFGYCCVCGRRIDLNYEDWYEHEDSGEYVCDYCYDDMKHSWKGEIVK